MDEKRAQGCALFSFQGVTSRAAARRGATRGQFALESPLANKPVFSLNDATNNSSVVDTIARLIREGFDGHFARFLDYSRQAQGCFERGDWRGIADINRARIDSYDRRVEEAVVTIETCVSSNNVTADDWSEIKRAYIGELMDHLQAECAETFYNSVACRVLKREYYNNRYIFWRPGLSTEHLQGEQPNFRSHYPGRNQLRRCLLSILTRPRFAIRFDNLRRDVRRLEQAIKEGRPRRWRRQPNYQIQVLNAVFVRNKAAYLVGRTINGDDVDPFIIPLLRSPEGALEVDTLIDQLRDANILFSFARAYFFVAMEVPSAYVSFLKSFMPRKSVVDLYATLGLHKQAKTLFYRMLHFHLAHSRDNFQVAPGVPGMVMLVFYLPSLDFVFKVIRDEFAPPKDMTREQVRDKYQLVKMHDRVGRLADTLEYSKVAVPLDRFDPALLEKLLNETAMNVAVEGDKLVIEHVYIERRMEPLDRYLKTATGGPRKRAIREYGRAIRDLAGANIFPGDMFKKNFGVTRSQRVVFYDYDEICYVTDCDFRHVEQAQDAIGAMAPSSLWSVSDRDVFPATFRPYFFGPGPDADYFEKHHADLYDPQWWREQQAQIKQGEPADIFPYRQKIRFCNRF